MPELISETNIKLERADLLRRCVLPRDVDPTTGLIRPPARTPGLHLSGLLKYIAAKTKITSYLEEIAEEDLPLRWALGHAWEEFAASLYPAMIWQPGELTHPVIMNCDGLTYEGLEHGDVIQEFKFSRAKRYAGADLIKRKWLWMMQGAGYCTGYGVALVRWHVLSAFEFPDPLYTQYLVRFSPVELADVQRMIDVNRESAIKEGYCE